MAIQYRSIEEVREEMEEEIESIPDRELPWFKVPEVCVRSSSTRKRQD